MDKLLQDLRFSLRTLVRNPRAAAAVVLCIALGVGINTAMFSLVNSLLFRPLEVERPQELLTLYQSYPGFDYASFSYPNYLDLRDRNEVFSGVAVSRATPVNLSVDGRTEALFGVLVSGNYFATLGVEARLGRTFTAEEDSAPGADPVVVLSHELWQQRFGGDRGILGSELRLNGQEFTVLGVAPAGFQGTYRFLEPALWVPMSMQPQILPKASLTARGHGWLSAAARLAPGVSTAQAQASLNRLAEEMKQEHPEVLEDWSLLAVEDGWAEAPPNVRQGMAASSGLVMLVVLLVLLIACANIAGLLLARGEARRREMGIRMAIGAGRGRLIRQLLTESVLLSLVGGAAGGLLAVWAARLFPLLQPPIGIPLNLQPVVDGRVLAFTLVLTLLTGITFGLVPAFQGTRVELREAVKGGGGRRRSSRRRLPLRSTLVVFQVALSMLLLVASGLFVRSLQRAQQLDPGFDMDGVLLARIDPSLNGYDKAAGRQLFERLGERLEAAPGVRAVAFGEIVPLGLGGNQQAGLAVEGYDPAPGERMNPDYNVVTEEYFETMRISLLAGRGFTATDRDDAPPVVIINQTMADRYWQDGDAVGRRLQLAGTWRQVVGIVENLQYGRLGEAPRPYLYVPHKQVYEPSMELHLKADGDPLALAGVVRKELAALDPHLPLVDVRTLEQHTGLSLYLPRLGAGLIAGFGLLALVLAAVGLYGVLAFSVGRRTREIGIRMALGAPRWRVFRGVLAQGLALTALGLGAGLLAALAVARVLAAFLVGTSGSDPLTLVAVALVLVATATTAAALPARRAVRVDPMVALREE